jgi:hypothetical protein
LRFERDKHLPSTGLKSKPADESYAWRNSFF